MAGLRLVIGLGNPGEEYSRTRHNAGFWLVDALAAEREARFGRESKLHAETAKVICAGRSLWLLKPATFMNHSGRAVAAALGYFKIAPEECLIAHDDLDLPPGTARLKFDGGHGGQNGLRDIMAHLGHGRFHRLRLGIGHPGHKDRVTPWVLGRPSVEDERRILAAVARALEVLPLAVAGEFDEARKRLHTKPVSDVESQG
jgi:PTH1 family peptidyl-tRNA hydrolase